MRIKSIVHVVAAWIMLVLTSEFSLTVAYDICDTNPWARILYVALNISGLLAAFYLYTRYIMKIKNAGSSIGETFPGKTMVRYSSYYAIGNMLLLFSFCKGNICFTKSYK